MASINDKAAAWAQDVWKRQGPTSGESGRARYMRCKADFERGREHDDFDRMLQYGQISPDGKSPTRRDVMYFAKVIGGNEAEALRAFGIATSA